VSQVVERFPSLSQGHGPLTNSYSNAVRARDSVAGSNFSGGLRVALELSKALRLSLAGDPRMLQTSGLGALEREYQ
jgi:hypothetical protein